MHFLVLPQDFWQLIDFLSFTSLGLTGPIWYPCYIISLLYIFYPCWFLKQGYCNLSRCQNSNIRVRILKSARYWDLFGPGLINRNLDSGYRYSDNLRVQIQYFQYVVGIRYSIRSAGPSKLRDCNIFLFYDCCSSMSSKVTDWWPIKMLDALVAQW